MANDKYTRRTFCRTMAGAAGTLALGTACNRRTPLGDTRLLAAPPNLDAESDSASVKLTWDPLLDPDVTGYTITRGDTGNAWVMNTDSTTFTDAGLINEREYVYTVAAMDKKGRTGTPGTIKALPSAHFSPVVIAKHSALYDATAKKAYRVDKNVAKDLIRKALTALTGKADTAAAFRMLLDAGIGPGSSIAVKMNCLAAKSNESGCFTHRGTVEAVVELLRDELGISPGSITVFDDLDTALTGAGFELDGSTEFTVKKATYDEITENRVEIAGSEQYICKELLDADYLINMPVIKDHNLAGVTFSLKNLYGCVKYPARLHSSYCSPGIVALATLPAIAEKPSCIIADASYCVCQGGPEKADHTFTLNGMIVAKDPLAADFYALHLVNTERRRINAERPDPSTHLSIIGTADTANHAPALYLDAAYKAGVGSRRFKETEA